MQSLFLLAHNLSATPSPPPGILPPHSMPDPIQAEFQSDLTADCDPVLLEAAQVLLSEAVYRSRAKQAASGGLGGTDLTGEVGPGSCGLGQSALVELEASDRGRSALATLFPRASSGVPSDALARLLTRWVERQDALDRKRNHFLRDFRDQHGYDRRRYNPEQRVAFETGVDAINAQENARRKQIALEIISLSRRDEPPLPPTTTGHHEDGH